MTYTDFNEESLEKMLIEIHGKNIKLSPTKWFFSQEWLLKHGWSQEEIDALPRSEE